MADTDTPEPNAGGGAGSNPEGTNTQPSGAVPTGAAPGTTQPVLGAGGRELNERHIAAVRAHTRKVAEEEATKKILAKLGVTDVDAYLREKEERDKELASYRDQDEERKRAAMTETERLRKDLEASQAAAEKLRAELSDMKETSVATEQRAKLEGIAGKYVNPKFLRYAVRTDFRQYVTELSTTDRAKLKALDDRAIEKWFKAWAAENPEMALKAEAAPATGADPAANAAPAPEKKPVVQRVVRRPITNGAKPNGTIPKPTTAPGAGGANATAKTFRPNQPNSMSKKEAREAAAKLGITLPG